MPGFVLFIYLYFLFYRTWVYAAKYFFIIPWIFRSWKVPRTGRLFHHGFLRRSPSVHCVRGLSEFRASGTKRSIINLCPGGERELLSPFVSRFPCRVPGQSAVARLGQPGELSRSSVGGALSATSHQPVIIANDQRAPRRKSLLKTPESKNRVGTFTAGQKLSKSRILNGDQETKR